MSTCLVLGGASCLGKDILDYLCSGKTYTGIVACNDAGIQTEKLDAWVTLHPQYWLSKGWLDARRSKGFAPAEHLFANNIDDKKRRIIMKIPPEAKHTEYCFPGQEHSGSSGMFAAKVALIDLGYENIVLCGMPMSPMSHANGSVHWLKEERDGGISSIPKRYLQRWNQVAREYKDRIRSMSGATKELLGYP